MNFVVALKEEAKPIVARLGLTKEFHSTPFPVFSNEDHQLIISGTGKVAAGSATGFLLGRMDLHDKTQAFLNIGIAGHGSLEIGSPFVVVRLSDDKSPKTFFPPQIVEVKMQTSTLLTCQEPSGNYQDGTGFDMEAHACYATATKKVTRELVQVVKVVSDNRHRSMNEIDPLFVGQLIEGALDKILEFTEKIDELAKEISDCSDVSKIRKKTKDALSLSQTQIHQFDRLINQAVSLKIEKETVIRIVEGSKNGKHAINGLKSLIDPQRILP